MAQFDFAVPLVTVGGASGAIQHLTSASQFPTSAPSALWEAPGVPAASTFFIISSILGSGCWEPDEPDLSSANTKPATSVPVMAKAEHVKRIYFIICLSVDGIPSLRRYNRPVAAARAAGLASFTDIRTGSKPYLAQHDSGIHWSAIERVTRALQLMTMIRGQELSAISSKSKLAIGTWTKSKRQGKSAAGSRRTRRLP